MRGAGDSAGLAISNVLSVAGARCPHTGGSAHAAGGEWGFGRHVIDDPELYREFENLHVSSRLRETLLERETRIAAFLRRLFARHGNFSPEREPARVAPRTVGIVRDYLHAKAESQVSIADLAQAAGVSGTQVIRAFSAETGMPPHSYLVSLRVERAKARCEQEPRRPKALSVGFSDQSQLTRHFKRLTGVTPGRFAAEARRCCPDRDSGPEPRIPPHTNVPCVDQGTRHSGREAIAEHREAATDFAWVASS